MLSSTTVLKIDQANIYEAANHHILIHIILEWRIMWLEK